MDDETRDAAEGRTRPRSVHTGRPPADRAGEVDARILEAATALFLERGFEATTYAQVAERARAGKASLYARYPAKEALFTAVIRRSVARTLGAIEAAPADLPLRERLMRAACGLMNHTLQPEVVALMRVIVAEATRFPEVASHAYRIGLDGGVALIAAALAGEDRRPATIATATRIVHLTFMPLQMRAMLGEDLAGLRAAIPDQVREALAMLVAVGALPPEAGCARAADGEQDHRNV